MTTQSQDPKRRALGRGLEALLPSRHSAPAVVAEVQAVDTDSAGTPLEIELDRIERNPFQTRSSFDPAKLTELAHSITATGVVQPIVVRSLPSGHYQLIAGERRLLASREAGKTTVPAIVREVSDEQAMEMTIVENLQRADLNPMEQARAYQRLSTDFKMSQEQMAVRTGKERASVTNFLRLLRLPAPIQDKVESGELSFGHARALLGLMSLEQMTAVAQKVMSLSMSVRQTESYVQGVMNPEPRMATSPKVIEPQDANVHEAQDRMQRSLGLRVRIEDNQGRGRVIVEYANLDDFDLLLSILDARLKD